LLAHSGILCSGGSVNGRIDVCRRERKRLAFTGRLATASTAWPGGRVAVAAARSRCGARCAVAGVTQATPSMHPAPLLVVSASIAAHARLLCASCRTAHLFPRGGSALALCSQDPTECLCGLGGLDSCWQRLRAQATRLERPGFDTSKARRDQRCVHGLCAKRSAQIKDGGRGQRERAHKRTQRAERAQMLTCSHTRA
jgi:hypothetical protein